MENALLVCSVQGFCDFDAEGKRARNGQGTARDDFFEGLSFEKFHGNEGLPLVFLDGMDGADSRVVQGRGRTGLAQKSFQGCSVLGAVFLQEFERDTAAEPGVFGFIHQAHAATA
jgi:hypothetical protein